MPRHSPYALYSLTMFWNLFHSNYLSFIFFPLKLFLLPLTFKKDLNIILSHLLRYSNILSLYSVVNVQEGLIKPSKINSIIRIIYLDFKSLFVLVNLLTSTDLR